MSLKLVYIDDEKDLCEVFSDNFATDSISIQTFTDPEEAIVAIAKSPPDLIFIDYRMPRSNGEEIARRIDAAIPKVLLSGDLGMEVSAHFIRYFGKPFDFDEMEVFIKTFDPHSALDKKLESST